MTDYQKNEELMHYGVLGMKWGHHKAKVVTSSKKNSKKKSNTDINKSVKEYSRKYDNAEKASNIAPNIVLTFNLLAKKPSNVSVKNINTK